MSASRTLWIVLVLLLAAGAWFLFSDPQPASAPGAGETAGAAAVEAAAAGAAAADVAAAEDAEVRRAASAPGAGESDAERAARAARGEAVLRLRATAPGGAAVRAAWATTEENAFADFDGGMALFRGLAGEEPERHPGDGRGVVEAAVPAGVALSVEVGGDGRQSRRLRLDPIARGAVLDLGEIALQPGGEIAGTVLDPAGAPVPGATVSLFDDAGGGGFAVFGMRRAVTEADGAFRFTGLATGRYRLGAEARGFAPAEPLRAAADAGGEAVEATLRLGEGRVVRGQVVDRDRGAVAGAEIFVRSAVRGGGMMIEMGGGAGREPDAVSGPDGRFTLRGLDEDGDVSLTARAQGFASGRAQAKPQDAEVLFTLTPALTLAGRLVDAAGAPVPGVEVSVERADDEFDFRGFWAERSATSGPDGAFRISGLDEGVWRVLAQTATHSVGDLRVDLTRDVEDLVARMEPAAVFSVLVKQAAGGAPIPGAVVRVEPRQESSGFGIQGVRHEVRVRAGGGGPGAVSFGGESRETTGDDGVAAFRELAEGAYRMTITADGFARQQIDFVRGRGPQQQEASLQPGANLRVSVLDGAGRPLPGVRVAARPSAEGESAAKAPPLTRTSDSSGRAVFSGMQPGQWTVDYAAAEAEGPFRIIGLGGGEESPKDPSRTGVEALLVAGADAEVVLRATDLAIPTVVVTRRGKPLAGAQVRLEPASTGDDPFASMRFGMGSGTPTGADGSARLQPVAPGDYDVVVAPGGGLPERRERRPVGAGEQRLEVDVRGGVIRGFAESTRGDLRGAVAQLERAPEEGGGSGGGRTVRGTFAIAIDSGGGDTAVSLSGGPAQTRAELDSSGRFVFEEVPEGEWIVRITAPGHAAWTSPRIALAEEQERDIGNARLSAGGTLRGVHRGAAASGGEPVRNILLLTDEHGRQAGFTQPGPDGSYEFRDLADGVYRLSAPPDYTSDPIEIKDGAVVTHDVPRRR